jgi:hypothetical protein
MRASCGTRPTDRERVAATYHRPAAFGQQASPVFQSTASAAVCVYRGREPPNLYPRKLPLTGPFTLPLQAISPRPCCGGAFEQDPFRAYPERVCCLAFQSPESRKHSGMGPEPLCNLSSCVVSRCLKVGAKARLWHGYGLQPEQGVRWQSIARMCCQSECRRVRRTNCFLLLPRQHLPMASVGFNWAELAKRQPRCRGSISTAVAPSAVLEPHRE